MMKKHPSLNYSKICLVLTIFVLFSTASSFAELPLNGDTQSPFRLIYEKVSPSIVMIEVEGEAPARNTTRGYNPFQQFFDIPDIQDEDQSMRPTEGMGSGVILDREGHIVTNNHVIEDAIKLNVILDDNEEYSAKIVGRDPLSDLAVIKLDLDGKLLPPERVAELGDSETLRPGDYAIAIGNPVGLERTITVGVISALGRHNINAVGSSGMAIQDFIQTDAQINPGNSGGALVDINGLVVGINNMYAQRYAGIGFSIPVNIAKGVVSRIIEFGVVKRGFVGIDGSNDLTRITKEIQEAMELESTDGVLLVKIVEDSPAEKAGLEHGDVIVSLDGEKIKDFNDFLLKIGEHVPGDSVELGIIHDKKLKTVDLVLGDRDDFNDYISSAPVNGNSWRGMNVIDLDDEMAEQYDIGNFDSGVIVVSVDEDSFAAEADLREGDVILEIEDTKIKDIRDFESIKEKLKDSDKRILIYRARTNSNGSITRGYVTIKGK